MIYRKRKTDPITLERVPVPIGFFKSWILWIFATLLIFSGWLVLDLLSISPQEQILIAENRSLQDEIVDSHTRVTNLAQQIDDLAETDQELYRLILQTDTIPRDARQLGVGGTDPYVHFDGFSQSTALLLRDHVKLLDELERKVALQDASYQSLMPLGVKKRRQLEQLPTIQPALGRLSSTYGSRLHPILRYYRMHAGVDISVPNDSPVYATGGGTIELIDYDSGYGNYIVIDHPAVGYKTLYGHLNSTHLKVGDEVVRGQQIALSGNTGLSTAPHIHYEVRDQNHNPLDPINFFGVSMTPEEYHDFLSHANDYAHLPSLD